MKAEIKELIKEKEEALIEKEKERNGKEEIMKENEELRIKKKEEVKEKEEDMKEEKKDRKEKEELHYLSCFQIFVRTFIGQTITLDVNNNDTIEVVKQKIQEREGIPLDRQSLIFEGKELENKDTLKECKIEKKSTLQLFIQYGD